ncbi:MAG: hypothetical protein K6U80_06930 [Firmicutes bacterium]|nr:hypothetical protein [Bacillota bacterium]
MKRKPGFLAGVFGLVFLAGGFWGAAAYAGTPENPAAFETLKFENPEIKLEANQIIMDSEPNLIEARGQVRLLVKESGLRFETEALDYNPGAQVVKIPGQVRFIAGTAEFVVDTFTYNVQTQEGQGGALKGALVEEPRPIAIDGQKLTVADKGQTLTVSGATFTRCAKPGPHYRFKASKITITPDRVYLTHILLYFEGVPLFYFPSLSLAVKGRSNYPEIETKLRYAPGEGWALDYTADIPINDQSDFLVKGSFSQGDDSNLGVGYGFEIGGFSNKSYLIKYFGRDWQGWLVEDELRFVVGGAATTLRASYDIGTSATDLQGALAKNFGSLSLAADGLYDSAENLWEFGLSLAWKYGPGWLGDWQLGVQARQVSKDGVGGGDQDNYGIYGGYQVDYRPSKYLTLSYLQLASFTNYSYTGFSPNLGSSALFQVKVPAGKEFSLRLGGTYNLTDAAWKSQSYGFTYDTCCYSINCQWDTIADTCRTINLVFKF